MDYNLERSFFENYKKLMKSVKLPHMVNFFWSENSEYADVVNTSKNVYLSTIVISECENIFYSIAVKDNSSNVFNSLMVNVNNDNIYFSSWVVESYKVFYSRYITNSNNVWFSTNLVWCSECIDCSDLDNRSYCIWNTQYEKSEYEKKKEEVLRQKNRFDEKYKNLSLHWKSIDSDNVSGNFIVSSQDIEDWHYVNNVSGWRNLLFTWWKDGNENMYDIFNGWAPITNDAYWVNGIANGSENVYIWANLPACNNVFYSFFLQWCSYCIWCIWLKNKSYCILNKQYTKEEWEELADKIFAQMDDDGILWDFFPWELNPFYFNDTMAWILWDFTKEEVEAEWYMWRDEEIKVDIPEWSDILAVAELNNYEWFDAEWNWKINPEILKKVIKDEKGNYYRVVKMEYDFLVKYGLPLSRLHWMDRMKLNFGV
jgi:hypothetical protein